MEADATVFGVLCRPQTPNDVLDPPAQLPIEYIRLFERVEKWMSEVHPDGMVSIIPDNLNSINGRFSKCLADFLFRAALGRSMRHLVVTPFWVDSSVTVGSQIADVVAYLLMQGMRSRNNRLPLYNFWRRLGSVEFRSQDGVTRGVRTIKPR